MSFVHGFHGGRIEESIQKPGEAQSNDNERHWFLVHADCSPSAFRIGTRRYDATESARMRYPVEIKLTHYHNSTMSIVSLVTNRSSIPAQTLQQRPIRLHHLGEAADISVHVSTRTDDFRQMFLYISAQPRPFRGTAA
jgi:hypothetical protein